MNDDSIKVVKAELKIDDEAPFGPIIEATVKMSFTPIDGVIIKTESEMAEIYEKFGRDFFESFRNAPFKNPGEHLFKIRG